MYQEYFSTRSTPQTEPIPGKDMVKNRAGGFVFKLGDWERLDRWLILGSSEPVYYATAKELTVENANTVIGCMRQDGIEVVSRIVEISESGRAPRNNSALFALAICAGMGDAKTKATALDALPRVARTATHLFTFLTYVEAFRGWGRGLKNSVAGWYDNKTLEKLCYQIAKYRQRGGWTHRDVLRLAHPKADGLRNEVYKWIVGKTDARGFVDTEAQLLYDFERLQKAESEKDVISILASNRSLSWEMIPTQHLGSPKVWEALLPNLPMTATIRNLARMTKNGLLVPMGDATKLVCEKITNPEYLRRARVHPFSVLKALVAYGGRRDSWYSGNWGWHYTPSVTERSYQPVAQVLDALDEAFYLTFGNIEAYGKRTMLALDTSGSMEFNFLTDGRKETEISARVASAAMAMVTARREPEHMFLAFQTVAYPLTISPRQRLDDVVKYLNAQESGGTNCALPMQWALQNKVPIDAFILFTDGETWKGRNGHPAQAIVEYRQKMGIPAKLVVVGMTATGTTITDPNDTNSMACVGFDAATPNIISQFVTPKNVA